MDSIGLLLMALLSLNSVPVHATGDEAAMSDRSTRTKCVIAARADVNRAKQNLQACTSVPAQQARPARAATPPAAQRADIQARNGNAPR